MTIQVVACLMTNPNETEALNSYFSVAGRLIESAGAQITQKIELGDPLIGDRPAEILMLVDYPDFDAFERVLRSSEYKSIIPIRKKAFLKYNICIVNENSVFEELDLA